MMPTSAQGKMLQSVEPSELVAETVPAKKSAMHLSSACEWRVADTMIHAAAMANAATVIRVCKVT